MPKIMNTSWLAVLLATIAFYMVGFICYGFLFEAQWLEASGMTAEQVEASMADKGGMVLVWGLLITLAQAIGVLYVIHLAGAKRLGACLKAVFWLFVTIAAPLLAYACLYGDYTLTGILIDYGHIFVGYMAMAAVYSLFRGKDAALT